MKKFTALLLIFSLIMLSVNLYAKERRGAKLLITKKDGQQIRGELITVKPNSLLMLNTEGKDVSVDIEEIKVIRVVKKSMVLKGMKIGLLIGAGGGALLGIAEGEPEYLSTGWDLTPPTWIKALFYGIVFGGIGIALGAIIGAVSKGSKTFQLEGMADSEIQETLDKLRKKARIRDYK